MPGRRVNVSFMGRSYAGHAPFTNCYGFDGARAGWTLRRRANLRYHRRVALPRGLCGFLYVPHGSQPGMARMVRAPRNAAILFTFDRSRHVTR